jgi:glutathione S-transferase
MSKLQIVGRSSSHFTRLPRIFAEELRVPYDLVPVYDMTALGAEVFADNPALKIPVLRDNGKVLFGALTICRAIAERAEAPGRIVWPEALVDDLSRNAQELVWHCMATQVQIVMGTAVNKLPADNPYFAKAQASLQASLRWLDANLGAALGLLPPRDLSVFEVSLHCLVEHLAFRPTVSVEACAALQGFSREFAERPSARRTVYSFDPPK